MKTKLFLVSLFLTVLTYAQIPTNGLVAQYNFDSGATLVDGANGQDFIQTGSALTTVTDRFGNPNSAISLNGDHLLRPDLNLGENVSYSFWIKTQSNNYGTIIDDSQRTGTSDAYTTSNQRGYYIALNNGKVEGHLRVRKPNGAHDNIVTSSHFIADDVWHHVVVRFYIHYTSSNGNYTARTIVFVDGVKKGDEQKLLMPYYATNNVIGFNSTGEIGVGTNRNETIQSTYKYNDIIDDLLIYNRGLTSQEVRNIGTINNHCYIPDNSILSFDSLTENSANAVFDASGVGTYDLAYHKLSEPFSSATVINGITNSSGVSVALSNLSSSTLYKVYLRTSCSGTMSSWSGAKSFRTRGVIYVNQTATGNNDGTSWTDAFTSLQDALNVSYDDAKIWIASGIYKPHTSIRETAFVIDRANVKIYGGFAGNENHTWERVRGTNETILSGDLNNNDTVLADYATAYFDTTRSENSKHIITVTNLGENLLLDGLTISDTHNNGSATERGGAIIKDKSILNLTIKNCIVKNNVSRNDNAGLLAEFDLNNLTGAVGELRIENSQFINNMSRWASGIYCFVRPNTRANITIVNSLFSGNEAADLTGSILGLSGSVAWFRNLGNSGSNLTLNFINNTVVHNKDTGTDQSLNNFNRSPLAISKTSPNGVGTTSATIENCIFWGNTNASTASRAITDLYLNPIDNLTVKNSIDEANFNDDSITSVVASSNADPLFTDLANADYTLTGVSPAIDTGDNTNVLGAVDLLGRQRIFNTTVDMGCYEYGAPTLGLASPNTVKQIRVFPNPATNIINISGLDTIRDYTIYTVLGKEVKKGKVNQYEKIEVSDLEKGLYLLKLSNGKTMKFIKK